MSLQPPDPIAASEAFDEELKKRWGSTPQQQLVGFARHARRTRRIEGWMALSILLDIALSVIVVRLTIQSNTTAADARRIANQAAHVQIVNAAKQQCIAANTTRSDESAALHKLIASLTPPGLKLNAAQQAQETRINIAIDQAYAPKDCSHIQVSPIGGSNATNGNR